MVLSEYILEEVGRVLGRLSGLSLSERTKAVHLLVEASELVRPGVFRGSIRDPSDAAVAGTAIAGHADYLVTGDKDLLVLRALGRCRIVSARGFAQVVGLE